MHKILFIGLGTMGYPMAGHLSKSNDVTVFNRTSSKTTNWKKDYKGKEITSLSEINNQFDFVISCIGNDSELIDITISKNGCFNFLSKDTIFIDHSTVSPKIVKSINQEARKNNLGGEIICRVF